MFLTITVLHWIHLWSIMRYFLIFAYLVTVHYGTVFSTKLWICWGTVSWRAEILNARATVIPHFFLQNIYFSALWPCGYYFLEQSRDLTVVIPCRHGIHKDNCPFNVKAKDSMIDVRMRLFTEETLCHIWSKSEKQTESWRFQPPKLLQGCDLITVRHTSHL